MPALVETLDNTAYLANNATVMDAVNEVLNQLANSQ